MAGGARVTGPTSHFWPNGAGREHRYHRRAPPARRPGRRSLLGSRLRVPRGTTAGQRADRRQRWVSCCPVR